MIITHYFLGEDAIEYLPADSERAKKITAAIGKMIVWDLEPYNVVEHDGFQEVMTVTEPRYNMPSRNTMVKVVHSDYVVEKEKVRQKIRIDIENGIIWTIITLDNKLNKFVYLVLLVLISL